MIPASEIIEDVQRDSPWIRVLLTHRPTGIVAVAVGQKEFDAFAAAYQELEGKVSQEQHNL